MLSLLLDKKSKIKKASIYKDIIDNPEKYILTLEVEKNKESANEKEVVIRIKKKTSQK